MTTLVGQQTPTFNSKISQLSELLIDNIEQLLQYFDVEYIHINNNIRASCPLHEGDNNTAFSLYIDRGIWACYTRQCNKIFGGNLFGMVRGFLSKQQFGWPNPTNQQASIHDTVNFIVNFLNIKEQDLAVQLKKVHQKRFNDSITAFYTCNTNTKKPIITREEVRKALKIPSKYYLQRNYSKEILDKYDIGDCSDPTKRMHGRAVVPIYDDECKYMLGCTGRSINGKLPKWKHDFKKNNYLYNLWFAKPHIMKSHIAILVESPGNVWRLEENGIHNSLGLFGCNLSYSQEHILNTLGILSLIIVMDNDEAGRTACDNLVRQLKFLYRIFIPIINKNDIGDMCSDEITQDIKPTIDQVTEIIKEYNLCHI